MELSTKRTFTFTVSEFLYKVINSIIKMIKVINIKTPIILHIYYLFKMVYKKPRYILI